MTIKTDKVKAEFAKRLHDAMDKKGYPVRGRARVLSKEFSISDKGAGKWLNGDAIPETSKIPVLAAFLNVNTEWLLGGLNNPKKIKSSNQNINNECLQKLKLLNDKFQLLLVNNALTEDQLVIIEGLIDGIDTTINTWIKPKIN